MIGRRTLCRLKNQFGRPKEKYSPDLRQEMDRIAAQMMAASQAKAAEAAAAEAQQRLAAAQAASHASRAFPAAGSPPLAETEDEDIIRKTDSLLTEMEAAARQAGIQPGDPMGPLLAATGRAIRLMGACTATQVRLAHQSSHLQMLAKAAADAEAARFHASIAADRARIEAEIGNTFRGFAETFLAQRIKQFSTRTALIAALVLVGSSVAAVAGGYWWGHDDARADIQETEAGLQAAFNNGPDAAKEWLDLMHWNNIMLAMKYCMKPGRSANDHGRLFCSMPLWLEASQQKPPEGS